MFKIITALFFSLSIWSHLAISKETCGDIEKLIKKIDAKQMAIKNEAGDKSLAELQIEHDQALARMLFYHGLRKAKQQYETVLDKYKVPENHFKNNVQAFKQEAQAIGSMVILGDLMGTFAALLDKTDHPEITSGEDYYKKIMGECSAIQTPDRGKKICDVLQKTPSTPPSHQKKIKSLIKNFYDYYLRSYPFDRKKTSQRNRDVDFIKNAKILFDDGLPLATATHVMYKKLQLLIKSLENNNLNTIPQAVKDYQEADEKQVRDRIATKTPGLIEVAGQYKDFAKSLEDIYYPKNVIADDALSEQWNKSHIVESLAQIHRANYEKEKFDFTEKLAKKMQTQTSQINRRIAYSQNRIDGKKNEKKIKKNQQDFFKMYNQLAKQTDKCQTIASIYGNSDKEKINNCLKNHLSTRELANHHRKSQEKVKALAREIKKIKGGQEYRLMNIKDFYNPENKYQKLDRYKHIQMGRYRRLCEIGRSSGHIICHNTLVEEGMIDNKSNGFSTLTSHSGEIIATLNADLIGQHIVAPLTAEKEENVIEKDCTKDSSLDICAQINKRKSRKKYFKNYHTTDPKNPGVYSKNRSLWGHGLLYAGRTLPNYLGRLYFEGVNAKYQTLSMARGATEFIQNQHNLQSYYGQFFPGGFGTPFSNGYLPYYGGGINSNFSAPFASSFSTPSF